MAFDFKKEYKEYYMKNGEPLIVNVPKVNYISVRGTGDPNAEDGAYKQAIGILYAIAYTLKMSYKSNYKIEGFFEYVVPPLEGFWWQNGVNGVNYADKSAFQWISVIRLPAFVDKNDFEWAKDTAAKKKQIDLSTAGFLSVDEGLCAQILHTGAFDDEPRSVAILNKFIEEQGYENDITAARPHHEIYMSDMRKTAPDKQRTIIRHPIKENNIYGE